MTGNRFYDKLHGWLFPIDEYERDIVPVSSYHYYSPSPFQKVMLDYLAWNGIDKKGRLNSNKVYPTRVEILETRTAVRKCGFSDGKCIEKLIVSEFLEMKKAIPNLIPEKFIYLFEEKYHNVKLVKFSDLEVQKFTQTTKQYFGATKDFLIEIQAFLRVVDLRTGIECSHSENGNWYHCSKVGEFVTPFAMIGLNCNKSAKFSINYFINPHLRELVGESLAVTVENKFNELANGELKDFIKMIPLERRYDRYFEELLRFSEIHPSYKAVIADKNSL